MDRRSEERRAKYITQGTSQNPMGRKSEGRGCEK
jgi:hypothetical protein